MDRFRSVLPIAYGVAAFAATVLAGAMPGSIVFRLAKVIPLFLLCVGRFGESRDRLSKYVGFGLFASLIGDAVIDNSFVAGLGAFLVGHVLYIVAMGVPMRKKATWFSLVPALGFCLFMYGLLVASGRAPEPLRIPVTIYMVVISTMLGRALGRALAEAKDRAAWIFLLGAGLFVISDSLIGINKWVIAVPLGRVWIMGTYYAGQWGIYQGSRALGDMRLGNR